jgi:hypothetical protein
LLEAEAQQLVSGDEPLVFGREFSALQGVAEE